jgi:acetyl esterase/lipase
MDENAMKMLTAWNLKMAAEDRIPLWETGKVPDFREEYGQLEPSIVAFLPVDQPGETVVQRGAMLVCAGGGFSIKAPHEGWPICDWLNQNGIAAFLLDYRLLPYRLPAIIGDAKRAMRVIRHHSAEWNVNPDKIGILGFSAGGQITVSVSTLFDEGDPHAADPVERVSCRPDVQVPCYPAISLISRDGREEGWKTWVSSLLGPEATADLALMYSTELMYSAERNVRETTPPAFLWGTCDDFLYEFWPPYLAALKEKGISFESHIFSNGPHGMGLAPDHPTACAWPDRAAAWLKLQGF